MDLSACRGRPRAASWTIGPLALAAAIACCSGSDRNNAITCAGADYQLGCVGDGRPASETTPGSLPTTSCAKDSYAYFKVHVASVAIPRTDIARCRLAITDAAGEWVADYILAGGTTPGGTAYGCSLGQTPADVGYLSYSSCRAPGEVLTFRVEALSSGDDVIQNGSDAATCAPYPPEVAVEVAMTEAH